METVVRDLMTTPAVTCTSADTLAAAAHLMQQADTGSVIVTELGKTVGILTERDLYGPRPRRPVPIMRPSISG
jgi:CBS domain-containing protein